MLRPYPSYRESGVPWLGKVPAHWEVCALRRKLRTLDGIKIGPFGSQLKLEQLSPYGFKVFGQSNVIEKDFSLGKKFIDERKFNELSACALLPGDLAVTMMGTTGKCVRVPEDAVLGIMDSHLLRLRVGTNVDGKFIARLIDEAPYIEEQLEVAGKGSIMHGLNSSIVKSLVFAVPPLAEQAAIVRFLDHADRRIRRYIRAKEKLIALLEEQKQVVIYQAVIGRIDVRTGRPYPAYKPSGVDWLGDIPAHWEFRAAKWRYREVDDRSKTGMEELLSVSHITGVTPRSEKNVTMFKAESNVGYKLCKSDDIVVNTMWAWMAALGVAKQAGIVSPSYAVYRSRHSSDLRGDYANLLLRTTAYRNEYRRRSTGIRSSRLRLYPEEFLRIKILCPPPEEQQHIVTFVANESKAQRRSIEFSRREIDLLREYRTRLIADVVTGKLDVREAAAAPPEEPDDPDAVEADCADPGGRDDSRPDRDRRQKYRPHKGR